MKTRTVYLLHIDPPFKHAQHYLGVVRAGREVPLRWIEHMRKRGAKLTIHARRAGCTLILTRIWRNADFALERRLKGRSLKPLCPKCRKQNDLNRNLPASLAIVAEPVRCMPVDVCGRARPTD